MLVAGLIEPVHDPLVHLSFEFLVQGFDFAGINFVR